MHQENRRPAWLSKRLVVNDNISDMKEALSDTNVNTVCESSLCPNLNECFSRRFATFLILGSHCTRFCGFCSVEKSPPEDVDRGEPGRILDIVKRIGLKYVIITSVTRDDLPDGGSGQFAKVIDLIKEFSCGIRIEVLVPDFKGKVSAIERVVKAGPDIFGHNIETVERLYPVARYGADYKRSLHILRMAGNMAGRHLVKSGIVLGLGETDAEVCDTMSDIRDSGCDILTIGQYLRPRQTNMPVSRFLEPGEFERYKELGAVLGFKCVASGPFVRSSYLAEEIYKNILVAKKNREEIL